MDNPVFSLDYYKIVRVPTSRGRDAIFIGIFTAGAHGNILFLGEESSSLVTSPLPSTSLLPSFDRIRSLFFHEFVLSSTRVSRIHHASNRIALASSTQFKFISPTIVIMFTNDRWEHQFPRGGKTRMNYPFEHRLWTI